MRSSPDVIKAGGDGLHQASISGGRAGFPAAQGWVQAPSPRHRYMLDDAKVSGWARELQRNAGTRCRPTTSITRGTMRRL